MSLLDNVLCQTLSKALERSTYSVFTQYIFIIINWFYYRFKEINSSCDNRLAFKKARSHNHQVDYSVKGSYLTLNILSRRDALKQVDIWDVCNLTILCKGITFVIFIWIGNKLEKNKEFTKYANGFNNVFPTYFQILIIRSSLPLDILFVSELLYC